MKRVMIFCAMATSLHFSSFAEEQYYFDNYWRYPSGSTIPQSQSYHSFTNDFDSVQLVACTLLRSLSFNVGVGTLTLNNNPAYSSNSPNFIRQASDSSIVPYSNCPLLIALDSIAVGLISMGFTNNLNQSQLARRSYEFISSNNLYVYVNVRSLQVVSLALSSTNTPFRAFVLDNLSGISSNVRDLLLNSNSALSSISELVSVSQSSLDALSDISSSASSSLSALNSLSNSVDLLVQLSSSINSNSVSAVSNLNSLVSSSVHSLSNLSSIADSSASLAGDFNSAFRYMQDSSGYDPWDDDLFHATTLLSPDGRSPWFDYLFPGSNSYDSRYLKYYGDITKGIMADRIRKYNDAVATLTDSELASLPLEFFQGLFENPGLMDQMIANYRYNTPISTNMLNIVTNHVERPLTNSIQKAAAAVTNELSDTKQAITNDLSDIKDILNSMISNNHVIVDNELDHPVPVTISGDMGFNLTIEDAQIFGEALMSPFFSNMLDHISGSLDDLAGFVTNELFHIHYNDFYGDNSNFPDLPFELRTTLQNLGIDMDYDAGFWSFNQGATLLECSILSIFFDLYCSVTNLHASSSWMYDENGHVMSLKESVKKTIEAFPTRSQLEDNSQSFTNQVNRYVELASVTNFLFSCTNSVGSSLDNVYTGFDGPPGTIRWFTFNNISFESDTADIIPALRLLRNGLAFGYSIVLLLLLPKFFLFWITHFSNLFLRVLGVSRFRRD